AKPPVLFRVEHADIGERRVEDLARAADDEPAPVRLTAAVHVAVFDPPPLMRVAVFFNDLAGAVQGGAPEVGWNVERVGQPLERDAGLTRKIVGEILRQIRIRALIVAVDLDGPRSHGSEPFTTDAISSRRTRFKILPEGLRGNSLRITRSLG